jgi:hypothetical protein
MWVVGAPLWRSEKGLLACGVAKQCGSGDLSYYVDISLVRITQVIWQFNFGTVGLTDAKGNAGTSRRKRPVTCAVSRRPARAEDQMLRDNTGCYCSAKRTKSYGRGPPISANNKAVKVTGSRDRTVWMWHWQP